MTTAHHNSRALTLPINASSVNYEYDFSMFSTWKNLSSVYVLVQITGSSKCHMFLHVWFLKESCNISSKGDAHTSDETMVLSNHVFTFATQIHSLLQWANPCSFPLLLTIAGAPIRGLMLVQDFCWACWDGSVPRPPLWWIQQSVRSTHNVWHHSAKIQTLDWNNIKQLYELNDPWANMWRS